MKKESLTKKENWLIKQTKGETSYKTHNCEKNLHINAYVGSI